MDILHISCFFFPIFFSFLSFFFSFFFGFTLGTNRSNILNLFFIFISTISSYYVFFIISLNNQVYLFEVFDWISFDLLEVRWSFLFDSLTSSMLVVISTISFFAHVYSISYMSSDPHQIRFMSYLSLFSFFMFILVTSNNLIQLFVGWEGVGICSYLLINFWYTRVGANKSSVMAVLVNKIGDIALLFSFGIIYKLFKSYNFSLIFNISFYFDLVLLNNNEIWYLCVFFIIGSVAKSAQLGLHFWLPEAMEGPTPVSSLIHAATMVTAGIFLIVRCSFVFSLVPDLSLYILAIGSCTTFFGASVGLFQYDIKKIVAYSTCSQLGYMFYACGFSSYYNSMFHLINHAFFKALLFLTAGYLIHSFSDEQDFRKMGGLLKLMPFSSMLILIGSLSLMGLPFTSGFYSKEKIIELFTNNILSLNNEKEIFFYYQWFFFFQFLIMCSMILTICYSLKSYIYVFLNSYNGYKSNISHIHYGDIYIYIPLFILSYYSIFSGYILSDMMVGSGTDFWGSSFNNINILTSNVNHNINFYLFNHEFIQYTKWIPLFYTHYFVLVFFFLFYFFENILFSMKIKYSWLNTINIFLNQKYIFINSLIIYPLIDLILTFSKTTAFFFFDKGIIELFGPYGLVKQISVLTYANSKWYTNLIYHYSGFLIIGIIFYLFIFFF